MGTRAIDSFKMFDINDAGSSTTQGSQQQPGKREEQYAQNPPAATVNDADKEFGRPESARPVADNYAALRQDRFQSYMMQQQALAQQARNQDRSPEREQ